MASFKMKITGLDKDEIETAILDKITTRFSNRRKDIRKTVILEIEAATESVKGRFQPHNSILGGPDTVGKLGIGLNGAPDTDKLQNAWKLLVPGRSSTIAKVGISFQRRASRFGRVNFSLDMDKFFNTQTTTYVSHKKDIPTVVYWMENFIKGVAVSDHDYVDNMDPEFNSKNSRTGIGHMVKVPGNQFVFPGVGTAATFDVLFARIKTRLSRGKFTEKIERLLGK